MLSHPFLTLRIAVILLKKNGYTDKGDRDFTVSGDLEYWLQPNGVGNTQMEYFLRESMCSRAWCLIILNGIEE
jgi:hypothetical protein